MSKKEKLKIDRIDLDNDLEIPEFDFDLPPPKDDRTPVKKIVGGVLSGAKSTIFSSDFIKNTIRKTLPDGFGEAVNLADKVGEEAKKLYNNAANQIKPSLNEMARAANKLAPAEKVKTKAALDSVAKWSENANAKYTSNDKEAQREAGLSMAIGDMFKFQAEQEIKATASQNIKDNVQTGLEIARHRDNFGLLNNINIGISRLSQYQEKITAAYQKKSIELQYRSYFVATDILEETKKQNALVKVELANITKNTALPESVKLTAHDSFKDVARNKFWGSVNEGLFGGRNDIVGKMSKKVGDTLKEKLASVADAFSMAAMGMEQAQATSEMMAGMEGGQSGYEMAGDMAGSYGADFLGAKAGKWTKEQLEKNKKIAAASRKVGSVVTNLPQHLNEFRKSNKGQDRDDDTSLTKVGNFFLRAFKSVIPNMEIDTEVQNDKAEKLTDPFHYTKQTHKSINEVIPGFLARIFRELQVLRTGDTKISLATYDFNKNKFSTFKESAKSSLSKIMGSDGSSDITSVLNQIDPDNKLSKEARAALAKKLTSDKKSGKSKDIKSLLTDSDFSSEDIQPHANAIKEHIKKQFKLNKSGDSENPDDIQSNIKKSIFSNLMASDGRTSTKRDVDELLNMLDPDGSKLNKEAREVLSKKLLSDNFNTRLGSSKRLGDKDTFQGEDTKQYAELFAETFKEYFKSDEDNSKEFTFNTKFNNLGKQTNDGRGFIQNMINLGQYDLLKSTGLISGDSSKIDLKKLQSYALGEGFDPNEEELQANKQTKGNVSLTPLIKVNKTGFEKLADLLQQILDKSGTALSDIRMKKNIKPVSGRKALQALRRTPVSKWGYKAGKGDGGQHIGPMAQTVNQTMGEDAAPDGTSIDLVTLNGMTMSAVQELDKTQQEMMKNKKGNKNSTFLDIIKDIGKQTIDKLEQINTTILNTGGVGGAGIKGIAGDSNLKNDGSFLGSLKTLIASGIDGGNKIAKKGFNLGTKAFKTVPMFAKKAVDVSEWGLGKLKTVTDTGFDKLRNLTKIRDVFIEGEIEPRIEEAKLKAGKYFLEAADGTRTVLKDISGIKGKIIDETGKVVISADELGKMFTKNIKGKGFIKLATKLGGWVVEKGNAYSKFMLNLIPPALRSMADFAKATKNKILDVLDYPTDIYVPGTELPVMIARIMKAGGYISKTTGKAITRPSEIDGVILNSEGEVVLSEEDLKKGIVDKDGKPIKSPFQKIKDFALGGINKTIAFGHKVSKQAIGVVKSGMRHVGNLLTGGINGMMNGINGTSGFGGNAESNGTLIQIRDLLNTRLPGKRTKFNDKAKGLPTKVDPVGLSLLEKLNEKKEKIKQALIDKKEKLKEALSKKKFNDKDGDGEREGSWRSMGKKAKDKLVTGKDKALEALGEKRKNIFDAMEEKIAAGKEKLKELAEGAKDLWDNRKGIGKGLAKGGRGLLNGAKALGGLGLRGASALGSVTGLSGLLGGGAAGAATAAGAAGTVAGTAGTVAATGAATATAGAGILSTLGTGAAAVGSLITAPVVLGALAVAGVAAIGYFGYKYLTRNSATKLELVRYVQYGFEAKKKDYISKVFGLEDILLDKCVFYDVGVAKLKDKDFDLEKALGIFDIKKEDTEMVKRWTWWFNKRFKPVFLTHLTALFNVNDKVKLNNTDKLTAEEKLKYLKAASFEDGPYGNTDSPIKDMPTLVSGANEVKAAIADAEEEINKDIKKVDKKEKSGLAAAGAIAAADAISSSDSSTEDKKELLDKDGNKIESKDKSRILPSESFKANVADKNKPLNTIAIMAGIGGPVSLGALALGAAGMFAYKAYNAGKISKLTSFRLVQYGFKPEEKEGNNAVLALEAAVIKNVTFPSGVANFNDKSFDISSALKIFGVSIDDEENYNNWISWFTGRFKPVFLTHVTALYAIDPKTQLSAIDDLNGDDKLKYLNLVKFDDGPYSISDSPIGGIKELSVTTKDINNAFDEAKKECEEDNKSEKTTLLGALKTDLKSILNPKSETQVQQGQTNVDPEIKKTGGVLSLLKDKFTNAIATPLIAVGTAIGRFFGFNATILETIRFKTYGLKTLERSKVSSLRSLEEEVFKNIKYNSTGSAEWSSTAENIINSIGKEFGIESPTSDRAKDWIDWFTQRFLPVYLSYLGLVKQATGKEDPKTGEAALKPNQQLDIATKISATPDVWLMLTSPWEDYKLSFSIKDLDENFAALREKTEKDELVEAKKTAEDKNKASLSKQQQDNVNKAGSTQTKDNSVKNAIDSKGGGVVDGETPITASGSSGENKDSSGVGQTPKMADGALASGKNAAQYIKLGPGVSLDGLNPELLTNFNGMVEEYGTTTGQSVYVTSGKRSREQQEALYKKDPKKAAKPGGSLHEFGLALDVSSSTLDALDKSGLMKKYGFTRPVGGETWHMEAAGIQGNIDGAKRDPNYASDAIEASLGRGGGGYGSTKGTPLGKRNAQLAKQLFNNESSTLVSNKEDASTELPKPIQTADVTKPTVSPGGGVVAGSKTSDASSPTSDRKSGYASSTQKPTIDIPDAENSKSEDFKSTVIGSAGGMKDVPDPKPGKGLDSVKDTIEGAAKVTGTDPKLMLGVAGMESSFDPNAKASTSSASGLFQFTASTWDSMLSKHGSKYGLDMNTSPLNAKANAVMGGEYIKTNTKAIASAKPNPTATDLYTAHFLGGGGAKKLFSSSPDSSAPELMPAAAKANKAIFYNGNSPRTTGEVYNVLDNKVTKTLSGLGLSTQPSKDGIKGPSNISTKPSTDNNSIATATQSSPSIPNTNSTVTAQEVPSKTDTLAKKPNQSSGGGLGSVLSQSPVGGGFMDTNYTTQPQQDTRYDMNNAMGTVSDTLKQSLAVQTNIHDVLKSILQNVNPTAIANAVKSNSPTEAKDVKPPEPNNGNSASMRSDVDRFGSRPVKPVPVPMNRTQI